MKGYAPARARGWEVCFSLQGVPYLEPAFAALRRAERPGGEGSERRLARKHPDSMGLGRNELAPLLVLPAAR